MNELKLYNTESKKKEVFSSIEDGKIRFYHCGPTVYWVQHIGNMRGMTMADLVNRVFQYLGYEVNFVRNYTDVGHLTSDGDEGEDKMAKGAQRENLSPEEIALKYIKQFDEDTKSLNILSPTQKPKATEYVEEMKSAVAILLEKGYAYLTPSAIYFDVSKAKDYARLSGQKLDLMEEGAGKGSVQDVNKRNPQDFSLWFFKTGSHRNALQFWPSQFESYEVQHGEGFPGWHLECSVMSQNLLGDTIDVHMGGIEHIPVHHTNEIAQSEAITGKKFVNYWLHNEHLVVDGEKMSKSKGTSYVIKDIIDRGFDPLDLRYFFLNAHYRSKQNFTWEALAASKIAREKLVDRVRNLRTKAEMGKVDPTWRNSFVNEISDDINIPGALAVLWQMLKSDISESDKLATILDFDRVFGLSLGKLNAAMDDSFVKEIEELINQRSIAKKEKNFELADEIRERLEDKGVILEDTADKTLWHIK